MTNKTTQTREGKSLLDIPIKDNPQVYFNDRGGSEIAEEIIQHLETNPSKYYAVVTPRMSFCSCGEKIPRVIGSQARSVEFLVGMECCLFYGDSSPLIGEERYAQKTVEFFNMFGFEKIDNPSTITPDKTLREIITLSYKRLKDHQKKKREGLVRYLETIQ